MTAPGNAEGAGEMDLADPSDAPDSPAGDRLHVAAAENSLFHGVDREAVELLLANAERLRLRAGDVVFEEASLGEYCYLVESGEVEISKRAEDGDPRTIGTIGPGDFFGELALFHAAPRIARATAATAVELVLIDRHGFESLRSSGAAFATTLASAGVRRLQAVHAELLRNLHESEDRQGALALAEIAHNLRAPLLTIAGGLRGLIHETASGVLDTEKLTLRLEGMLESAAGGIDYADSLLEYLHDDQAVLQRFTAQQLVEKALELASPSVSDSPARVKMDITSTRMIEGDETRLATAIGQILETCSARVASPGDRVRLTAADGERGVEISIVVERVEATVEQRRRDTDRVLPAAALEAPEAVVERHRGRLSFDGTAARDRITLWLPSVD